MVNQFNPRPFISRDGNGDSDGFFKEHTTNQVYYYIREQYYFRDHALTDITVD